MSPRAAETGRSYAVPFLVLALLLLAALASPVRAADEPPVPPVPSDLDLDLTGAEAAAAMEEMFFIAELWDLDPDLEFEVMDRLLLEIALIEHLDGFVARDVVAIEDIHAAYSPWPDVPVAATADFLFEVDDDLAGLENDVAAAIGSASLLSEALDELPTGQRAALRRGETGVVPSAPYIRALNEILSFGNTDVLVTLGARNAAIITELPIVVPLFAHPFALDDLRTSTNRPAIEDAPLTSSPEATLAITPEADAPDPAAPANDSPWIVLGAIAGAGLLLGVLLTWLLFRRNRNRHSDDRPVTELVFEAHRRLTTTLDEAQIAEIAGATATSITDASDAFIFRDTPDGLRRIGETTLVVTSALQRVVETAQPLVATLEHDPAVSSAAVCAVPLVTDGRVTAVLVARRPTERPFDNEDRRRLEMLAPALGGALASADMLGSYETMALVDGLTSLGNRRRLDGDLETTLNEALSSDLPVAFAMIDVDHFKHFNDSHGHEAGDRALQTVAKVIADTVRATDVVYRYGGEEFSVLLPGATVEEATAAAERVRAAVEAARIDGEESQPGGRLTISVGISTLESGNAAGLKTRADEALYDAKAQGRNRAVIA